MLNDKFVFTLRNMVRDIDELIVARKVLKAYDRFLSDLTATPNVANLTISTVPAGPPSFGDLRVWHFPNLRYHFYYPVQSIDEAKTALKVLKAYDLSLPDSIVAANASGLELYEKEFDGEQDGWCEWYNELGEDIGAVMDNDEAEFESDIS